MDNLNALRLFFYSLVEYAGVKYTGFPSAALNPLGWNPE